ncbi:MAG: hypothetical protein J5881_04200 [Clostridia bacterium]|nr:hypothetical protein [Clostridia bacterium]
MVVGGVWTISYSGGIGISTRGYANYNTRGVRPAVFLEPTVTLTKTGTGENVVWTAQ